MENIHGKVIGESVIELPTITSIDYEAGLKKSRDLFGHFGCSAVSKKLDNGDLIVGRSLDLFYSHNPVYVIRSEVPGFLKTIGLAYNVFDGKSFKEIKENGVTPDELLSLLFFTVDIMNEKGLYIEGNMRADQPESTGIKKSTGTNPDAKVSLAIPALVRYLGERCANVDEALELVKSLNVFGLFHGPLAWGGALYMADESGHHGVLELVDNKFIWNEGAPCQTNFYLNKEYKDKATMGSGLGRYDLLMSKIDTVKDEKDMANLMKEVRYSQLMDPTNSLFDPCSESCGFGEEFASLGGELTLDMIRSKKYHDVIMGMLEEEGKKERAKSLEQLKDEGTQWLSVWQTVANCNKKSITFTCFEDDALTFTYKI